MMEKIFVVVVTVMLVAYEASAAPGHRIDAKDVCDKITGGLDGILSNFADPVKPTHPLEIRVNQDHVAHIYIKMDDSSIFGLKDFRVRYCDFKYISGTRGNISVAVKSPKVTLETDHYFINGSMVDHIDLDGEGPGMISVDEMDVSVTGSATVQLSPLGLVFDSAVLDLEMWRWTVNLENLMPGTDLGTVFNEFFTMYGPPLFDVIENNINNNGKLVDFLNRLFQ